MYGVFSSSARSAEMVLELPEEVDITVRYAIEKVIERDDLQELKRLLIDGESGDPRPNALILVSGREIGSLNGLATELRDNDELALLPIAHGG